MELSRAAVGAMLALGVSGAMLLPARSEEGFWPFDHVPVENLRERYAFTPDEAWLEKVRLSCLRVSGHGSASLVSAHGLVMTNRHVVSSVLQAISTPGVTDFIRSGFVAHKQSEECPALGMYLEQLLACEDVTTETEKLAAQNHLDVPTAFQRLVRSRRGAVRESNLRIQGFSYQPLGGYRIAKYKIYDDVRLVFAAELAAGYYGGDQDNFNFPRYDFDVAFLRVYENGRPAETPNYFPWSPEGAGTNELIFIAGNPGETTRYLPGKFLELERDAVLPTQILCWEREADAMRRYGKLSPIREQQTTDRMHQVANQLKRLHGMLDSLSATDAITRRKSAQFQGTPEMEKGIEASAAHAATYLQEFELLRHPCGCKCALLSIAERIAAAQLRGVTRYALTPGEREQMDKYYWYDPAQPEMSELAFLTESLATASRVLPKKSPLLWLLLEEKTPAQRAGELLAGTHLRSSGDVIVRTGDGLDDSLLAFARKLAQYEIGLRQRHDADFGVGLKEYYAALGQKDSAAFYPDANSTLRLSYGVMKGLYDSRRDCCIAPYTSLGRMFDLNGSGPYRLPLRWSEAQTSLDVCRPLNFAATFDSHGGNSGSPVFNRYREITGLFFDSNYPGLLGAFMYDSATKRGVCVDSRAIMEVMRGVYHAQNVVDELQAGIEQTPARP